jgi:prolyl-tRNA editing enzyme YbaK/EbsC (Cys-tRNA(Pro) deacylase)
MSDSLAVLLKRRLAGDATAKIFIFPMVSKATGGVSPVGWVNKPEIILIDQALNDYGVAWAAAGHPHSVYPTSFEELARVTGATPMVVGD